MEKKIIRTKIVQGLSSRMYQAIEDTETIKNTECKIDKEYLLQEVFNEKDVSFDELSEEYNVFQKTGNSKMFAWMYVINDNFGIVIDSHIYLYHYDKKMYEQQKVVIPWMYTESKKYIGDTWWFEDQEIIEDIQKLSLLDFLEKYKGY